ncbi:MAG: sugar transporter substrate-binding protein, partial [Herbinix sp.]|nr:sugar transporter substrate-binding protein [Herbinix sp.]
MKKNVLSGLLVAVMVSTMALAGCSKGGEQNASNPDANVSTEKDGETTKDEGKSGDERIKITYAQWGNEVETAATQKVADKFNSEQDRITVEVVKIDHDTYVTKLNAMATAGELPDTGIMSEAGVLKFAENGLLADISEMYGEGDAKPLDALTFRYEDKPVAYSAANEVLNLWYNIDLLNEICKKQGLDPA